MRPEDSPFPAHWWGSGLEQAGLEEERPDVGTYGQFKFGDLPPLPFPIRGDFRWLDGVQEHPKNIGVEHRAQNTEALRRLRQAVDRSGMILPADFLKFMGDPKLQTKVRSSTDCFLDLCPSLVEPATGGGRLIRFLADSQGCVFWYLQVLEGGSDSAVVASPHFYGGEGEDYEDGEDPSEISFCSESFESFLCRFWLENEIWYSVYCDELMPEGGAEYLASYRRGRR